MRKTAIIFLVLGSILSVSSSALVFASDVEAASHIAQVTVYPDSALIARVANLKLNPGEHTVLFSNIIPEIDENSLKVSVDDDVSVKLFGAKLKREYLEKEASERVEQLKEQMRNLENQMREQQDMKMVLLAEKEFLAPVKLFSADQIPKDLATKMPVVKDLENTFKFLDSGLRENYAQTMECDLKIMELQKKIEALRKELAEIAGPAKKMRRSIAVDLEVLKPTSFNLQVSYLVRGAFWQPIYDARANFEKSQVELVSYGVIRQNTGEDWPEVEVSLSTAKPTIGGRMPYVAPWVLRLYQPQGLEDRFARKSISGTFQYQAFEMGVAPPKAEEKIYAQAEEKGIAVVYKLPRKATIKADGSENKLPISSQMLEAKFEYSTFPRATPSAYLGSRVTNAKDLQLLSGRVNIFLEGDFVGTSSIDNIGPGEEFDLYLGVDENVKVKREQVEKKMDDVLIAGIPAPNRKTVLKYKTTIENYKNKKIKVIFFEAMPVSEDEKIKVKIISASLEPKEKDWKDRKGIWRWELELAPKEKKEIFYIFSIDHPRDMMIEGL